MFIKLYTRIRLKWLENKLFLLHIKMIAERLANSDWNGYWQTNYSDREERIRRKMHRLNKLKKICK